MLFGGGSEASLDLKSVIEAWILYLNNQLKKKKRTFLVNDKRKKMEVILLICSAMLFARKILSSDVIICIHFSHEFVFSIWTATCESFLCWRL